MTRIKGDPEHVDSRALGGGGGRRKQSKPIRVFTGDMDTPIATPAEDLGEPPHAGTPTQMDVDGAIDSSLPPPFMDDSGDDNGNMTAFPTKYHQLGSVFQESINSKSNGDDDNDLSQEMAGKSPVDMETEGVPVGKNKIFHQDAYCELCDREFCNKYFLKTHKANMHGVFDEDSNDSNSVQQVPAGFAPLAMITGEHPKLPLPISMPQSMPQPLIKPKENLPSLPNGNNVGNRSPTSDITKLLQASKAPQMTAVPNLIPGPPRSIPATPPKTTNTPGKSNKPGHDMEDYCEICQKHFCNKYYLKKHKQDVHGIVPEPSPASSGKRGRPPMSAQLGQHPPISMPSSLSASLANSLIMPPIMSNAPGNGPQPGLPGLGNVMLINPFAPPMLLQGMQGAGQPVLQGMPPGFPAPGLSAPPTSQPSSSESPKSGSANTPTDSATSVLNAEAYCEICRKEFCNKYFLRVHKATKHGIFLDEDMMPTTGPQSGLPVLNVPAPGADMPRDLPPGTINITPKDPENLKANNEDSNEAPKTSDDSNSEVESCHLCKKQFVNKYNLKVHMINAHGLTIPDFDLSPPRDNKNRSDKQPMQSTMFGNMIAAKLADRVMCDICNKEVCNKYFLKTHKIKVHGLDPAKVEAEAAAQSPQKRGQMAFQPMQLNMKGPGMMFKPLEGKNPNSIPGKLNDLQNKIPELKPIDASMMNGDPNAIRPKDEDLLKMGIDPEAYCEICKKEFCSKYFLKTHKQNIHGIKMDSSTPVPPVPMPLGFPKLDPNHPEGANGLNLMAGHNAAMAAMAAFGGGAEPLFPLNLMNNNSKQPSASGNTSPASQPDSEASGPRKWRESPNAAKDRQVCELCQKELCNKMFLRSHLLQKHGLMWDMVGPQSSATPLMPFPGLLPGQGPPLDLPLGMMPPGFMGGRIPEEISQQPLDLKKSPNQDDERRSRDDKPSGWHLPLARKPQDGVAAQCEICNSTFGDKVTLQLHMIQDHPGDVIVSARSKSSENVSKFNTTNIGLNLRKKYQKSRRIRGRFRRLFSTPAAPITNGGMAKDVIVAAQNGQKKKFRCAYCQNRFASRADCQQHIRSSHPSARSSKDRHNNKENQPNDFSSKKMDVTEAQASPLCNGGDGELTMQSFVFEGQGSFAPARLVLPVYQKVDAPISVTLRLTPALQQ